MILSVFTYCRYAKCVYSKRWSWDPRCALSVRGISEFLNTHICLASQTPEPDVARSNPQQETKSRAFHHSNSSKQLCWREKPETYQVEQVWKPFLACLCDFCLILDSEILSVDQHVRVRLNHIYGFKEEAICDLQCWSSASLFTVKSLAKDTERNQGNWIIFANYSCLLWW